jgi:hypothetical protein
VLRTAQMAQNGKNRKAILTILRFRRTDVILTRVQKMLFVEN